MLKVERVGLVFILHCTVPVEALQDVFLLICCFVLAALDSC